jgi:hypothetical protein
VPITVSIGANPAGGTLSGTTTAYTDWSGTATFSGVWIDKAGAGYTLIASSPGYAGIASNSFTVVPAAAAKLVATGGTVLAGPASSAATLGPVTVQRQDVYGNPVTAESADVSLAASSAATSIFAATANGPRASRVTIAAGSSSASFFYGDTKAAAATITAASPGLTAPAPITATITAASPGQLKFNAVGPSVDKNKLLTPPVTVRILDAFGNQTDSNSQISLLATNCNLKTASSMPASLGVAAFTSLEFAGKATGSMLTATSGSLTADSNKFNVN